MSFASKVTLGASICSAIGIIYYVQAKQQDDNRKMHEGVIRDKERQHRRKIENLYNLQRQAELTKIMKSQNKDDETTLRLA